MFKIPFGEHSPRVTVLQILLNSHRCMGADGKRLTVDGEYGKNTKGALASASLLMGLGDPKGNAAAPDLIKAMLSDVDYSVITSVDLGDPALQADIDQFKREGNDPIVLGGMCNGLQQMVTEVTGRAQKGHVAALRFDGHGNLGRWLTISVGNIAHLKGDDYKVIEQETNSYISSTNFAEVSGVISPLSSIFAPFGFVEHLGCTLGARRPTQEMLKKLADMWGVPIRVGITTQPIGTVNIMGPSFTAFPKSLTLQSWSKKFQDLELLGVSRAR